MSHAAGPRRALAPGSPTYLLGDVGPTHSLSPASLRRPVSSAGFKMPATSDMCALSVDCSALSAAQNPDIAATRLSEYPQSWVFKVSAAQLRPVLISVPEMAADMGLCCGRCASSALLSGSPPKPLTPPARERRELCADRRPCHRSRCLSDRAAAEAAPRSSWRGRGRGRAAWPRRRMRGSGSVPRAL